MVHDTHIREDEEEERSSEKLVHRGESPSALDNYQINNIVAIYSAAFTYTMGIRKVPLDICS